jgi:hypothetical protein
MEKLTREQLQGVANNTLSSYVEVFEKAMKIRYRLIAVVRKAGGEEGILDVESVSEFIFTKISQAPYDPYRKMLIASNVFLNSLVAFDSFMRDSLQEEGFSAPGAPLINDPKVQTIEVLEDV